MKIRPYGSIALALILVTGLLVGRLGPTVLAQAPATIDFIIPADTSLTPSGNTDAGDTVVFTGRAKFVTQAGACVTTPDEYFPVQDAVVIDPGAGQRATRLVSVLIVISTTTPVQPGTRLSSLQSLPACTAGGISYNKYRGTVQ